MEMFAIKDVKSNSFGRPSIEVNENTAKRSCSVLVNEHDTMISTYPEDFELYYLGSYDEKTGAIKSDVKFVCQLAELKKKEAK